MTEPNIWADIEFALAAGGLLFGLLTLLFCYTAWKSWK